MHGARQRGGRRLEVVGEDATSMVGVCAGDVLCFSPLCSTWEWHIQLRWAAATSLGQYVQSFYFLYYFGNMFFILLWCFVVLTYYWSAGKVLAYTVNGGYVSPNYSVWWFWPYNLWLLMLSIVRSLSKLLFFLSLSSKHVHFQYCQCFVSWPEAEVFTLQFRLIWFRIVFGLSFPALAILHWYYNYNLGLDDTFFLWFEQPAS
jgi:hypothetical protein